MKTNNSCNNISKVAPSTDRTVVLEILSEFVRMGHGRLEEAPNLNSQILYLESGEIYWLRPHEIMRIQ